MAAASGDQGNNTICDSLQTISLASIKVSAPIKSGWMTKKGKGKMTKYQRRWCVLSGDGVVLRYYREPNGEVRGEILLANVTSVEARKEVKLKVHDASRNRVFEFKCETTADRDAWVAAIEGAAYNHHLQMNKGAGKRAAGEARAALDETDAAMRELGLGKYKPESPGVEIRGE